MAQNFNLIDRYAQALYQATEASGEMKQVVDDINLCSQILLASPEYFTYLAAPVCELEMQKSVIQTLSKQYKFNNLIKNFLLMLCVNGRLNFLKQVLSRFIMLYQEAQDIIVADVKSAAKLTENQIKEITKYLEKKLDKKILLNTAVDPKIMGGLIIKMNFMVIDNSISNKINKIKFNTEELIN